MAHVLVLGMGQADQTEVRTVTRHFCRNYKKTQKTKSLSTWVFLRLSESPWNVS